MVKMTIEIPLNFVGTAKQILYFRLPATVVSFFRPKPPVLVTNALPFNQLPCVHSNIFTNDDVDLCSALGDLNTEERKISKKLLNR